MKKINAFAHLCYRANEKQLLQLLKCFLSPQEQNAVADRFFVIQALLKKKLSQREIASHLNVSISKITRGSNLLKTLSPSLKAFLKRSIGEG